MPHSGVPEPGLRTGVLSRNTRKRTIGGLKYFLGQAGAITPELYVTRSSADDFNWTSFGLRVGVSVFFGGN